MGLFDSIFKKRLKQEVASAQSSVSGSLKYIPGSQTPMEDVPITLEEGKLVKRMYVQPEGSSQVHSNIPIYTGNPFRDMTASTLPVLGENQP